MNKQNESKLNMYDAVIAYCNNNSDTVATLPAFQTAFSAFETTVGEIHNTVQLEAGIISGIAADKNQLRIALCQQASDLCAVIFAFASSTNNNEIKEQVNYSFSELKRITAEMLVPVCSNIYDVLNANIKALKAYGITADNLSDFQTAMDSYEEKISSPRNAVSQRAAYGATLRNLFKQANGTLRDQLDKMAVQFKTSAEDFFIAYKRNRAIIRPGAPKAAGN